jgi:hypothetical protein
LIRTVAIHGRPRTPRTTHGRGRGPANGVADSRNKRQKGVKSGKPKTRGSKASQDTQRIKRVTPRGKHSSTSSATVPANTSPPNSTEPPTPKSALQPVNPFTFEKRGLSKKEQGHATTAEALILEAGLKVVHPRKKGKLWGARLHTRAEVKPIVPALDAEALSHIHDGMVLFISKLGFTSDTRARPKQSAFVATPYGAVRCKGRPVLVREVIRDTSGEIKNVTGWEIGTHKEEGLKNILAPASRLSQVWVKEAEWDDSLNEQPANTPLVLRSIAPNTEWSEMSYLDMAAPVSFKSEEILSIAAHVETNSFGLFSLNIVDREIERAKKPTTTPRVTQSANATTRLPPRIPHSTRAVPFPTFDKEGTMLVSDKDGTLLVFDNGGTVPAFDNDGIVPAFNTNGASTYKSHEESGTNYALSTWHIASLAVPKRV